MTESTSPSLRILVIDDLRCFGAFSAEYARNSSDGRLALERLTAERSLDELWLDHDLGPDDDIRKLVLWMAERAFFGNPVLVHRIFVISSNPAGAQWIVNTLGKSYAVRRVDPMDYDCSQLDIGEA